MIKNKDKITRKGKEHTRRTKVIRTQYAGSVIGRESRRQNKDKMEIANLSQFNVETWIKDCQREGHIQQVAFSTYHHALTQICFSCKMIRTSIKKEDCQ